MTIREQLEQDKMLEPYYYFIDPLEIKEEIMEKEDLRNFTRRLGEIQQRLDINKKQQEYLKKEENVLKTEYENIMLELWELLPGLDNKKGGINNGSINSQTTRSL